MANEEKKRDPWRWVKLLEQRGQFEKGRIVSVRADTAANLVKLKKAEYSDPPPKAHAVRASAPAVSTAAKVDAGGKS